MESKRIRRFASALAIGGGTCLTIVGARADATDDLLEKLLQKGILTQQEVDQLKQRKAESPAAAPAPQATAAAAAPAAPAQEGAGTFVRVLDKGIGVAVGPVNVTVSGEVNGFYVNDSPDKPGPNRVIDGGLATVGNNNNSAVRNGLLPGDFSVELSTVQEGYNIAAHFGLYPGLNSVSQVGGANSAGVTHALGTTGIDFRQEYLTIGTDRLGTFKFGRDIGLCGAEAILNDFTLFGVGSTGGNVAPSNTSLGRIGLGYVYADWIPQITYQTPTFAGFSATVGVFQPFDAFNFSGLSGNLTAHDEPQFQGKLAYTVPTAPSSPVKAQFWTNVVTQSLTSAGGTDALPAGHSVQGTGWDFGGKLDWGPASLVATGYVGSGLGTTGLFFDAVSATGAERDSEGYYVQGSFKIGERFTLSGSYGLSELDLASGEINPLLVKDNESYAFGAKYHLTKWVDLVSEFTHTTSTAHNGNQADENTVAAGGIAFF
jgi:predicted porin